MYICARVCGNVRVAAMNYMPSWGPYNASRGGGPDNSFRVPTLRKVGVMDGDRIRVTAGPPKGSHFHEVRKRLGPVSGPVRQIWTFCGKFVQKSLPKPVPNFRPNFSLKLVNFRLAILTLTLFPKFLKLNLHSPRICQKLLGSSAFCSKADRKFEKWDQDELYVPPL